MVHITTSVKWSNLEQQFHNYFFFGINDMKITDLTILKQRNNGTTARFVQRFIEVRNKCYSLSLEDKQLAKLAFQDLLPTLRDKYASHDCESLSQLVRRMSQETVKAYEPRRNFQKKVSYLDYSVLEDEDNMIGLAEWVKGKKTMSAPLARKSQRNSALISLKQIRYLICCFSKGRLNSLNSITYHLQKS
jgi:hypothetical protein